MCWTVWTVGTQPHTHYLALTRARQGQLDRDNGCGRIPWSTYDTLTV